MSLVLISEMCSLSFASTVMTCAVTDGVIIGPNSYWKASTISLHLKNVNIVIFTSFASDWHWECLLETNQQDTKREIIFLDWPHTSNCYKYTAILRFTGSSTSVSLTLLMICRAYHCLLLIDQLTTGLKTTSGPADNISNLSRSSQPPRQQR